MKKNNYSNKTIKRILRYLGKYKIPFVLSLFICVISVSLSLYIPILIGNAIDLIIGKDNVDFENVLSILLRTGVIAIIIALLQWLIGVIYNKISFRIVKDIRVDAFNKIEALPIKYIDSHQYGEIVSKVIADVDQFADGLLMGFSQLFSGIVTIIGTLIFMVSINYKIALVVVLLTPLSLLVANFIAKNTYTLFRKQSEIRAEQTALVDEMIGNLKVVKSFSREKEVIDDFDCINDNLKKCSVKAIFFSSLVNPSTRFINAVIYAFVTMVGALAIIGGGGISFSIGSLSCFLSYANQYSKPFNEISGVVTELQNALACAQRIFDLIDEPAEIKDSDDAVVLTDVLGNVSFSDVYFSYTDEQKLIENLNLSVKQGQKIAIVGPTGCGKTTLINLLMRFYDVKSGSIKVDGYDVRSVTRHSLRDNIGMVLQDTWIKSGTIRDNIIMGKPDATEEEIISAAKSSHAHGFIKRLPNGYDTYISEEECSLSQGQKQLLCISRVMLCLPPMLILDEATSSIDTRTEIKIQEAFTNMMKGRTSFIVAHRLSTIREADIILVMNNGKIIEQGNHEELLAKKDFYYNLYNSQFEKTEDTE